MSNALAGSPSLSSPIASSERIQALDVVRGFALIGIFLMNVEWFTRPIADLGTGVDISQTGINYLASWLIYTFVQGKFWTMFSLLFGMGFAVMLGRAETASRSFVAPYIRRIIGLFLFGSAHYVLVWTGDILHNYALTAIFLLLITTNSWKVTMGLLLSFIATGALVYFQKGQDAVAPFGMHSVLLAATLLLTYFLNRGPVSRYWKWGVGMYSVPFVIMLVMVGAGVMKPKPAAAESARQEQVAAKDASKAADAKPAAGKTVAKPAEKTDAQKRAENKAKREKQRQDETRLYTQGTFWESIVFRTKEYMDDLPFAGGLSFLALPMFLIGFWFVRSGVIGNIAEHLPVFRRLVWTALPIGLVMTLASVALHSNFVNADWDNWTNRMSMLLFRWGMMPQSIGYVGVIVCLLYTDAGKKLLSPLRYAGQMALTNYLSANAIGMWYFSGYGLGQWGNVPRAGQVVFVFTVFALQLIFSTWWLKNLRYGPAEWVWRAITYWQIPPMRRGSEAVASAT